MTFKVNIIIFCLWFTALGYAYQNTTKQPNTTVFLKAPTGQYGVGFEDFHWINQKNCPDFNFNGKNKGDFSLSNTNYCHEIVVRIYYPTTEKTKPGSPYYPPMIEADRGDILAQWPNFPKKMLKQLSSINSFSIEKSEIIKNKKFPVLLLSPGFGCPAESYENTITELVSQGYIVVGINTPFINLVALPNGHVVKPAGLKNEKEYGESISIQSSDLIYVYNQIHKLNQLNTLFSSMDLNHIGLFGHSIGARVLADVAHAHPTWFQAIAPLDIGNDNTGASLKKFKIPVMYQISSVRKVISSRVPVSFDLDNNGYLVTISPDADDRSYSHHMNFNDISTLQYVPAYNIFFKHFVKQQLAEGFQLILMSHQPTYSDVKNINQTVYVLFKKENTWQLVVYNKPKDMNWPMYIDINKVNGLSGALTALHQKPVEQLSTSDLTSVKQIVTDYNNASAEMWGDGNGWEITDSINIYLVQFFDMYLKGQLSKELKQCISISKNTVIHCGPGIF